MKSWWPPVCAPLCRYEAEFRSVTPIADKDYMLIVVQNPNADEAAATE